MGQHTEIGNLVLSSPWIRYKKSIFVTLFLYWLILNWLTLHSPFQFFATDNLPIFTEAEFLASDVDTPFQLPDEGWQSVSLPDDWYHSSKQLRHYWYRVYFPNNVTSSKLWAVYLPSVTHNAEVFINGEWIGRGGPFNDPVSRNHNRPLFFEFDSSTINAEVNLLEVRVKASYHKQGYLGPIHLAPAEVLEPAYQWKVFARVDLIQWLTVGMFILSMIVFLLWAARRKDTIYLVYSAQLLIWAVHNLNLFVSEIPTSAQTWEKMTMATLGWAVILMVLFNHRFLEIEARRIEWALVCAAVLGSTLFLIPDTGLMLQLGYGVWDSLLIVIGGYSIVLLVRHYYKNNNQDAAMMLFAGIPIFVFGFHDILLVNHQRDRAEGLIIQYSAIPALLLFSWFLARRFVRSVNLAEELNETLERRIANRECELKHQYENLQRLQKENVLSEERERIMRDMHDGIGGQLISIATTLQKHDEPLLQKIRHKVVHSITDLRLVIDSLDTQLNDIPALLGTMRERLNHLLENTDIELGWHVTDLPEIATTPTRNLHIMRVIQEAITNAIKHSQTSRIDLFTGIDSENDHLFVSIRDYGVGILEGTNASSRGLTNMQYRAKELGGDIELRSETPGTSVILTIPLSSS